MMIAQHIVSVSSPSGSEAKGLGSSTGIAAMDRWGLGPKSNNDCS
jgi:hypothetical protein